MKKTSIRNYWGIMALALFALIGCGEKDNAGRLPVSGNVTYMGQPVATGFVCFTPDPRKGNRGPQGVARIVNGFYSTQALNGRGSVAGPQIVEIRGFGSGSSQNGGDSLPMASGKPLFPPYITAVDISSDMETCDFEVLEASSSTAKKRKR